MRSKLTVLVLVTGLLGGCPVARAATEHYVSPTGLSTNTGTVSSPWDFGSAISAACGGSAGTPIAAGDTVYMRAGNYPGPWSYLCAAGTVANPIVIRNYPGERAVIKGTSSYASGLPALYLQSTAPNVWVMSFGGVSGGAIEFTNDSTVYNDKYYALFLAGPNQRVINCIFDHNFVGLFLAQGDTLTGEVHGNVFSYNLYSVYGQNATGQTKLIENNFTRWNYGGYVFHLIASASQVSDFFIRGNVIDSAGLLGGWGPGGGIGIFSIIPAGNGGPNTIINNMLNYRTGNEGNAVPWDINGGANGGTLTATNNYVVGGDACYQVNHMTSFVFTNNTCINRGAVAQTLVAGISDATGWGVNTINNNTYISIGASPTPFAQVDVGGAQTPYSFAGWRTLTGQEAASTFSNTAPTVTKVFRYQNKYEPGRGTITVYNWANTATLSLDPSQFDLPTPGVTWLRNGDTYEIRNRQNWFGALVASGTYNGSPISVNASGYTVAQPNMPTAAAAPTCTAVVGGGSLSAGVYSVKVTFQQNMPLAGSGVFESFPGAASANVTVAANGSLSCTGISTTPGSASATTYRNIYRTVAGGATWLYDGTITDNTTTVYTSTKADAALTFAPLSTVSESGPFFNSFELIRTGQSVGPASRTRATDKRRR